MSGSILQTTHSGASQTMKYIVNNLEDVKQYANGSIWILFNRYSKEDDNEENRGKNDTQFKRYNNKRVIDKYNAIEVKKPNGDVNWEELNKYLSKINSYAPKDAKW